MADTEPDAISIDRGPSRQLLIFNRPDDLIAFLDVEREFWSWVDNSVRVNNNNVNSLMSHYRPEWTGNIRAKAEQWRDHADASARLDQRNQIENLLRTRFKDRRHFSARDPEAAAIHAIAQQNLDIAAVALATLHGIAPLHDQNFVQYGENVLGIARGFAIAAGINPSAAMETATQLSYARQRFEEDANKLRAIIDRTVEHSVDTTLKLSQRLIVKMNACRRSFKDIKTQDKQCLMASRLSMRR